MNGEVIYPADTLYNDINNFYQREYLIEATSDTTTIELVELVPYFEPDVNVIEWYIDNMSLTKVFSSTTDAITVTNIHQLVYDTVDVTLN